MWNIHIINVIITLFSYLKGFWFTDPDTLQASLTVVVVNSLKKNGLFPSLCCSLFPDKTIVRAGIVTFTAVGTCFKVQHRYKPHTRRTQVFLARYSGTHDDSADRLGQIAPPRWISFIRLVRE